jgi:AraC-like DNA-binding protein
MKPKLRKAPLNPEYSFIVRKDAGKEMKNYWQYHPEYEIIYIKKSTGSWIIGDSIGNFENGEIVILGPNVPHTLRFDPKYLTEDDEEKGEAIIILFQKDLFNAAFLMFPEAKEIEKILQLAEQGLRITGKAKERIPVFMEEMLTSSVGRRLVNLLEVLQIMAENGAYEVLSSKGFLYPPTHINDNRINTVFEFTFNNYENDITIEEVADLVDMTKYSFCRYFKEITRKTYFQFLMEVRIGKACRLLIEEDMNASEAAYSCGYNSISHFNHQFRSIKNMSPLEYKFKYLSCLAKR